MAEPITTEPVRLSYANTLATPKAYQPGDPLKYSVVLMFDKKSKPQMDCLRKLYDGAMADLAQQWPNEATRPRIPVMGADLSPIKDGDKACNKEGVPIREKNPEYVGHYLIRVSATDAPMLVDRNRNELMDKNKIYSGCYAKVNLNSYTYDKPKSKGVTFGLNGVWFWEDGDRIGGGRPSAEDMFGAGAGGPGGQDNPDNYGGFGDGGFPESDTFGGGGDQGLGGDFDDTDIPF